VLLSAVLAVLMSLVGASRRSAWTGLNETLSRVFPVSLDIQVFLGLLLYLSLSPITQAAFRDVGAAMRTPALRFFLVEHIFGMFVALALAHIGRARIRRMTDLPRRHRIALIWFGLALLIIVATLPWPGLPYGRPLLRY
jgi:hypothetical protein